MKTASKILRARLAMTNRVDICVLDYAEARRPSNFNEHQGRLFCYFATRPSGLPYLLAFARKDPTKDISHIFCFYVNTSFRIIQPPERKTFVKKIQPGARLGIDIKLGVINAIAAVPKVAQLSVLIQLGEYLLDSPLYEDFVAERRINNFPIGTLIGYNQEAPLPQCSATCLDSDSKAVWDAIRGSNFAFHKLDLTPFHVARPPLQLHPRFDVLKIQYKRHLAYGLHHKSEGIVMILLPHPAQFSCERDAEEVTTAIKTVLDASKIECNYLGATRFIRPAEDPCNSSSVLKAIVLAVCLPLLTIKQCDVDFVLPTDGLVLAADEVLSECSSPDLQIQSPPYAQDWPESEESVVDVQEFGQDYEEPVEVDLDIDVTTYEPFERITSQVSTQATLILSQREVEQFIVDSRRARDVKYALQGAYPSVVVAAMDDPKNDILTNINFFQRELSHIVTRYGLPATVTGILGHQDLINQLRPSLLEPTRLVVAPLQIPSGIVCLIIDKTTEEWGLLNPDAGTQRDQTVFNRIQTLLQSSSFFNLYGARQLTMTCHFHTNIKLMHLLMSVYCICQSYQYAEMLPLLVIYTEKRLRQFCHSVCLALQHANRAYNFETGLVRSNGFLAPGAFRALPSLLTFEQSVVPADQCVFCAKRYFKNLGSHMSMAHGGQGLAKRQRRRWLENLR